MRLMVKQLATCSREMKLVVFPICSTPARQAFLCYGGECSLQNNCFLYWSGSPVYVDAM